MKKIVLLLMMLFALAGSSLAFAADGGDLNREQRAVERMVDAFDGEPVPAYTVIAPLLSPELEKNLGEKGYATLQAQVKEKFGTLKEAKFFAFQRFDQGDRVTYVSAFTKEKVVTMIFAFDKNGKMTDFAFAPYKEPEKPAEQGAPQAQPQK